ncbi:MAG: hypothetical protein HGB22_08845 [Chlorobiaceae bacterium]|nr:hypothetical protein [Chlorobiaceae bacterium]
MKSYALLMLVLLTLAGCSTTYKGTVKGASIQEESRSKDMASISKVTPAQL